MLGLRIGSWGSAASSSRARRPLDGLPAARAPAAAGAAPRLHDHVAELAGVALAAAQQAAVGDDPAADPDLAEDDQDVLALRDTRGGLGGGGQVALVVDADGEGAVEPAADEVADGDVVPVEVGARVSRSRCRSTRPATPTVRPMVRLPCASSSATRVAHQLDEVVDDHLGVDGAGVEGQALLADDVTAEVEGDHGDVVDVDLGAEAADGGAVELDRGAGAADGGALHVALADQAALGELGDEAWRRSTGSSPARWRGWRAIADRGHAGRAARRPRLVRRRSSWSTLW